MNVAEVKDMLEFPSMRELDDLDLSPLFSEKEIPGIFGICIKPNREGMGLFKSDDTEILHIIDGNKRLCAARTPAGEDNGRTEYEFRKIRYDVPKMSFMDALAMGYHVGSRHGTESVLQHYAPREALRTFRWMFPMKTKL